MRQPKNNVLFVCQKLLAFLLIYMIAAVIMEGVIILLFLALGYDILQGEMPTGAWTSFLPLYGFIGFSCLTILYVRLIEKRPLASMKLSFRPRALIKCIFGLLAGAFLIGLTIIIEMLFGQYRFAGFGTFSATSFFLYFLAYLIQGSTEEIMCRGFLQNILSEKIGTTWAIVISAVAFLIPHLSTIIEFEFVTAVISIMNIFLVSILFSLAMIRWNSIWVSIGIHTGWNFILAFVCGIQLTGSEQMQSIFVFNVNENMTLLTGGAYGVEASLLLAPVLCIVDIYLWSQIRKKGANQNGISSEAI